MADLLNVVYPRKYLICEEGLKAKATFSTHPQLR